MENGYKFIIFIVTIQVRCAKPMDYRACT